MHWSPPVWCSLAYCTRNSIRGDALDVLSCTASYRAYLTSSDDCYNVFQPYLPGTLRWRKGVLKQCKNLLTIRRLTRFLRKDLLPMLVCNRSLLTIRRL